MSFLSKTLGGVQKNLGGALGIAAPFLPGPWGLAAGAVSGLIGASGQQRKADELAGQQQGVANTQVGLYNKNAPLLTSSYMKDAGFDPTTGAYDPSYNPNQPLLDKYYSDDAINSNASSLYDPSQLTPAFVAQQEATNQGYDNAVNSVKSDLMGRGFGYGNSLTPSAVTQIRLGQASANTQGRRSLLSDLYQRKNAYIENQRNAGQNVALQGFDARRGSQDRLGSFLSGSASQGMGTIGGLQGMYQSNANTAGEGVASSLGQLFKSGALSGLFPQKRPQIKVPHPPLAL